MFGLKQTSLEFEELDTLKKCQNDQNFDHLTNFEFNGETTFQIE